MTNDFINNRELEENIRKYEEAKKNGTSIFLDADQLADIAEHYYTSGRKDDAMQAIEYAISMFPGSVLPLCFLAREALSENDIAKAEKLGMLIDDKQHIEYIFLQAEIMLAKDICQQADNWMEQCYEDTEEAERDGVAIDTAFMFFDYELYDYCEKWLSKCSDKSTVNYRTLQTKLAWIKGNHAECQQLLNTLIDENPFCSEYWNNLASSQFLNNELTKSIESCEYSLAIEPDNSDALLLKANCLCALTNFEEAAHYYKRYAEQNPSSEIGELFFGICLSNLGKYEDALHHFSKALDICPMNSPNLSQLYKEYAYALACLQRLDEALALLDICTSLPDADTSGLLAFRGTCYLINDKIDEADSCFTKALSTATEEQIPQIRIEIATAILDNSSPEWAYEILHEAYNKETSNSLTYGWGYYALACHETGHWEEFLYALEKACTINPTEAQQALGEIFPPGLPVEDYVSYLKNHPK